MQLTVTAAGIAAIVAAQNNGTNAVLVSQIGVTAATFNPSAVSALPQEIKRITTFAGEAVSDDTIHVNIADDSADTYTLRGFGLYLSDGTLFAVYGNPVQTTIIEKSAAATMLLACDVRFAQLNATQITFGDSTWTNPPASETVSGVSRRATLQQHIDAAATDVTAHPAGIKAMLDARFGNGAPSAFVKGLLNLATATLLRVAIGVKDVATRDMGHGNGIDADLLDGKHASEFANTAHSHVIGDVTGLQAALDGRAAVGHIHTIANVTGLQAALDGKSAVGHQHDGNDITGRLGMAAQQIGDWNTVLTNGWFMAPDALNSPASGWLIGEVVCHSTSWVTQTLWAFASDHRVIFRRQRSNAVWGPWERCRIHESEQDARYPLIFPGYTSDANTAAGFRLALLSAPSSNTPDGSWTTILNLGVGDYITQLANPWFSDTLFTRAKRGGVWQPWRTLWSSANFDPNTKANLSGANFTGSVTAPTMQATSSDERIKFDIRDLTGCLEKVRIARARAYRLKIDGTEDFGFIAQEHREHFPEAVHESEDGMLYVRYGKLEPYVVGAISEMADMIARLSSRVEALERGV